MIGDMGDVDDAIKEESRLESLQFIESTSTDQLLCATYEILLTLAPEGYPSGHT